MASALKKPRKKSQSEGGDKNTRFNYDLMMMMMMMRRRRRRRRKSMVA
jgi:hypothetical protein